MEKRKLKQTIAGSLLREFAEQMVLYTVVVAVIFGAVYWYGHRMKIWHGNELLFMPLVWVKENWGFCFFIVLFFGGMVIAGIHIWRFASVLESITAAVGDLANQRVSYIKLPGQLHEVELELNQVLARMQKDREVAKEAEQRKNDMIVYMAHDLKTPLTSVIGYLTLLQDEKDISEETKEKYLGIALRKAERLEDLTNEFFEITKYNFSNTVLSMSRVNLSLMLEQLTYEFAPMFSEKGVTLKTQIESDLQLSCDVEKMERVFDNLFKNAFYYCYENTEIVITLQPAANSLTSAVVNAPVETGVELTIQNAGKTIPKEKLEHLFEQFFRMDSSRSSNTGGSGLGLAIAKEIITLHHGTITCESENETITFKVYLPQ